MVAQTYGDPPSPEALSHRPLDEALFTFQDATGIDLLYDPALVAGKRTGAVAWEGAAPEAVLRALLDGTDLSFYRLSTGTYAIREAASTGPLRGRLEGYVQDHDTGVPLPQANVLLVHPYQRGRAANADGVFSFTRLPVGRYVLRVSHVGYAPHLDTVQVWPNRRTQLLVELYRRIEPITPIIVEGNQLARTPRSMPGTTVLQENLTRVTGPGTSDAIRSLNVLSGVRVGDARVDVHIQGGEAGEHQFRLDGVPIFEPVHLRGLIGALNPFALDRIEVHKAGFRAREGSYLAGVIDARHALSDVNSLPVDVQVDPMSVNARMNLSTGSPGGVRADVMAAYRRSIWNVYSPARIDSLLLDWNAPDPFLLRASLIALREQADDPPDAVVPPLDSLPAVTLPDLGFDDVHAAGQLRFPGGHTLYSSYYRSGNRLDSRRLVTAFDTSAQDIPNPDQYRWTNENVQLRWSGLLSSHVLATTQVWSSRYQLDHEYLALGGSQRFLFVNPPIEITVETAPADDGNRMREVGIKSSLQFFQPGGSGSTLLAFELDRADHRFILDDAFTQRIAHEERSRRLSFTLEEQRHLGSQWTITAGARMTHVDTHEGVYAEPRLDVQYQASETPMGVLSVRGAAGVYRQFVNQFDISNISPSALFPAVRFWMPIDSTVRPPLAYHLAGDVTLQPSDAWTLRLEGYYKDQPHLLQIDYQSLWQREADDDEAIATQEKFLHASEGYSFGGAVSLEHASATTRAAIRYEHNVARREYIFQDTLRVEHVPWSEPHRVEAAFDWRPHPDFIATARWRSGWGRIWGFRRAYYDFFGTSPTRQAVYGAFDFRDPEAHRLPAIHQLDLGAAYTHEIGPAALQFRLDLLNALNRANVADLTLIDVEEDGETVDLLAHERYLLARSLALSVRLQW